jgi:hypothetical protein
MARQPAVSKAACTGFSAAFGPDDIPGGRHARQDPEYTRESSSPMCAFPASGHPPAVIFGVQGITRAAGRTPQQRLGM